MQLFLAFAIMLTNPVVREQPEGSLHFAAGYPKAGPKLDEIVIKGAWARTRGAKFVGAKVTFGVNGGITETIPLSSYCSSPQKIATLQ